MKKIYLLFHEYTDDGPTDDAKLLGIFLTHKEAKKSIKRYANLPGFQDWPNGFSVDTYTLDETEWNEGFSYPES